MKQMFYHCRHCGNIIVFAKDSGAPITCCDEQMIELIPDTIDASIEKHIPVFSVIGNTVHVKVGATEHPMLPEHYIEWISLQTKQGDQRKELLPGEKPAACFAICDDDEVEAVYAYCNLHGLWEA